MVECIVSFHCVRRCCGMGKWNRMGWEEEVSVLGLGVGSWMWCLSGRCTLALMPSWSTKACEILYMSCVWMFLWSGW